MKRDMDLVRKILLEVEELEPFERTDISIDGYDMQEIAYHCEMLYDAGYIKDYYGVSADGYDGVLKYFVQDLTWEGHELLDNIREKTIWDNTKNIIKGKCLPMAIETIKMVSSAIVSSIAQGAVTAYLNQGGTN